MISKIIFILAGLLVVLFVYGRYVEPNAITIRTIDVSEIRAGTRVMDGGTTLASHRAFAGTALKGKSIVHLSDLHLSGMGKFETDLLETIQEIDPDLIFLTGDYIQWGQDNTPALEFLSCLKAKIGVFAVMGDYDYSDSKNSCLFCHEKQTGLPTKQHHVKMLRNASQKIRINNQVIRVAGIDEGYDDVDAFMESLGNSDLGKSDPETPLLVLSHSPLAFDRISDQAEMFVFSGDTHGGQVKFPVWVFKLFGYQKNTRYNYGLFKRGNKTMYVTRGVGTSHIKFRLFCPPEIAVFRF